MSYTVWDVETTIKSQFKRKASPFGGVNHVVASGWKRKGMATAIGDYFGRERPADGWFAALLDGTQMLVGFNIKFDILHAIQQPGNYQAWMDWVAHGGRVWDCQLAEYLLHGMAREQHMLSLDEVAPRYGGHLKNDAVKALWQAGIDTTEIDKDLLLEYLIGAPGDAKDKGDIGNTEAVFLGQVAALRARGSLASVLLNMDSLLFTIEAEHNGMHVAKQRGLEIAAELDKELAELRIKLNSELPNDLPFEFNWGSRFHLSALIFGGKVKYKAKAPILDDDGQLTYYQKDELHYVLTDGTTTVWKPGEEHEGVSIKLDMYVTFKAGKNAGEFKTKKVKVKDVERGPKERYEDFLYEFKGYTQPLDKWKTSVEGVYSTGGEVIASLEGTGIPFLESLAGMAALAKDLGTYYITTDADTGESKGMLTLVGDDNIVHHGINHTSTVTGRFSSSNPNLQNVSSGSKSQVKSIFTSRFNGGFIVQSDFTSLEIYVQAILTDCPQMIADLKAQLDMHIVRLSQKLGKTYEEIYTAYKAGDKEIALGRKYAKVFSFQRAYGAGVEKISTSTGIPKEDVEALIAAESARYPEVDLFYEMLTAEIQKNRTPTSRFIQHPDIPGLTCQLGRSYYFTPDKCMYSYSESPAPKGLVKRIGPQSFSPTEIKNYVVQGTGATWAKAAMAIAVRMFYRHRNFGGLALIVNQVHDAVYLDAAQDVVVKASALLHACMEEASAYIEKTFGWTIKVPVPTETKMGSSMIEENDMPDGFKIEVAQYRKLIRETFMGNYQASFDNQ